MTGAAEQRTYAWQAFEAGMSPLEKRSGLEFFRGLADGSIPPQPITSTIGWTIAAVDYGVLRLRFKPQPWLFHAAGILHGGIIATLLDSAMSGSILSTRERGQGCTTVQLSVIPIRAVRMTDTPLVIEGRIANVGRRVGIANGTIADESGQLFAQGSTSCLMY